MLAQNPEHCLASPRRVPMVMSCAAFTTGIAANEFLKPAVEFWIGSLLLFLLFYAILQRKCVRVRSSEFWLVLCICCVGGIRHYVEFSQLPSNEISRFVTEDPQPTRMLARLLECPQVRTPRPSFFQIPWKQQVTTSVRVECLKLNSLQIVSGKAILRISGAYSEAEAGDIVEILGQLSAPRAPVNPGEFDYRKWLGRQGVRAIVRCQRPQQVRLVTRTPLRVENCFPRLRHRLQQRLTESLPEQEAILASALLLGVRTNLTDESRQTFVRSGTFHLLAISGLHIGILAYLLNLLFRLANISFRTSAGLTVACLVCYLFLTEFRPSVFRAVVLISLYLFGTRTFRVVDGLNLLCVTALLILIVRPAELFSAGAQLSFLAVLGIFAIQPLSRRLKNSSSLKRELANGSEELRIRRLIHWLGEHLRDGLLMGIGVTLMTFPALAYHYQFVAVWGIPLTVLLIPIIALSIGAGMLLLVSIPVVSSMAAVVLTWLLNFVEFVAQGVSTWSSSTVSVSIFSATWIAVYLIFASIPLWCGSGHRLRVWMPCLVAFAWGMTGGSPTDQSRDSLQMTFLSVGHGLSVAIEEPDGHCYLYDAGSSEGGLRVAGAVRSWLKSRGKEKLRTIFISHADFDHYSAIPDLIAQIEVESIVTTEQFRNSVEPNLIRLRNLLQRRGVPIHTVSSDDRWQLGTQVILRVLHPISGKEYDTDNASSLVLELQFAGRTILLTGDLSRSGFQELRHLAPGSFDCLLAPHHGSLIDNTPEWAEWADPNLVIVSSGSDSHYESLREIYGTRLEHTFRSGAVTVTISPEGELTVETGRSSSTRR